MKKFIVTFHRGSGSCYDEEIRYFEALNEELLRVAISQYKKDNGMEKWSQYIDAIGENLDKYGSEYISSHYG